jgi:hypothetical protein
VVVVVFLSFFLGTTTHTHTHTHTPLRASRYRIRKDLVVFICVLLAMIIVYSAAIFYAERDGPFGDQFDNIPQCMWWTVITFTTVGYGEHSVHQHAPKRS